MRAQDLTQPARFIFAPGSKVYLVLQVGVAELRNANRLISTVLRPSGAKIEVVLNRYSSRALSFDEASITKALTMSPAWKIPGDYAAARDAQNTATPLALETSAISRAIHEISKSVAGSNEMPEKKRRFQFFK